MSGHTVADPNVAFAPGALFDVNLIQYLGVAVGPLNPVDTDPVDRAARLLGIIYGNLGQIIQVVTGDGIATGNALSVAGFNFVFNGVTWDMVREGNIAGSLLVDPTDRAARLLGIAYGENAQLQQLTPADALTPNESLEVTGFNMVYDPVAGDWNRVREGNVVGSIITEDTGLNTNPRRYEKDNGFYSAVVTRAGGVATALWTIATAPARTAGQVTTIYTLEIENSTGAAVTGWLEIGGVAITVPFHVADDDSIVIDFVGGFNSGDADVNCNASVNDVVFSIKGTEA